MTFFVQGRGGEASRLSGRGGGWSPLSASHVPSSSHSHTPSELHSLRPGVRLEKLAGEGSHRAQTALTKCLNGQAWAVPRWSVADTIPALWAFQEDPDTQMGTTMDGQPGITIKQREIRLSVCIHTCI